MRKKSNITELSAPELLTKMKGASIKRKVRDVKIDYSDIPKFSNSELRKFKRSGRPLIGESPRKAISIRIEEDVLEKLKLKAKKNGVGYQSLINTILKKAV